MVTYDMMEWAKKYAKELVDENNALRGEVASWKERYELEQIRYEGISSANEELRKERNEALASIKRMQDYFGDVTITAKKLEEAEAALSRYREAVEWALEEKNIMRVDVYDSGASMRYFDIEWFKNELRRRAGEG